MVLRRGCFWENVCLLGFAGEKCIFIRSSYALAAAGLKVSHHRWALSAGRAGVRPGALSLSPEHSTPPSSSSLLVRNFMLRRIAHSFPQDLFSADLFAVWLSSNSSCLLIPFCEVQLKLLAPLITELYALVCYLKDARIKWLMEIWGSKGDLSFIWHGILVKMLLKLTRSCKNHA